MALGGANANATGRERSLLTMDERALRLLALGTLVTGFVLIVIGAVVRIEGAGMGCGDDWPICNGEVVPTFSYLTAIEYLHRVVAGIVLLLTAGLVWASWRSVRPGVRALAVVALLLVLAQAGLGAVTVFVELNPKAVTAHLGMAQAYLAVVITIVLLLVVDAGRRSGAGRQARSRPLAIPATIAAAATFALLLSGAYTASSGAAWACPQWPGCHGNVVPTGTTPVDIHLLHRWFALIALVAVSVTAVRAVSTPHARLAFAALALMGLEIVAGGANIWFELADWVRVLHLAVATLVWSTLVALVVLIRLATSAVVSTHSRVRELPAVSGD